MKRVISRYVLLMVLAWMTTAAQAATRTWSGAGGAGWANAANWDVLPVAGDALVFPSGAATTNVINDFPAGTVFLSLTFQGAYLVSGNSFNVGTGGLNVTAGLVDMPMQFGTSHNSTWTIDGSVLIGNAVNISTSVITIGGTGSISFGTVNGTTGSISTIGSVNATFTGPRNFTGATTVTGSSIVTLPLQTMQGPLAVLNGGTLRMPNGAVTTNNYSLAAGATHVYGLNGLTIGTYSSIGVGGTVSLGGTFDFTSTINPPMGTQIAVIGKTSAGGVLGTFAGLPEGATVNSNGQNFTITYVGGDGNDVMLTAGAPPTAVPTTTTLVANPDTVNYGVPITLTATVSPATATGTVQFREGATVLGTATLSGGTAQLVISSINPGFHLLNALYAGAAGHLTSTSANTGVQIFKSPVSVTLTPNPNPSEFGHTVNFTMTVAAPAGTNPAFPPGGNVTLYDGPTSLGTFALTEGATSSTASYGTPSLIVGNHTMTATYNGDARFNSAGSPVLTQMVGPGVTSLNLITFPNPSSPGQQVTITVGVTPGTATGNVTIKDGAATLAIVPIAGGQAQYTTSSLPLGAHPLTAQYPGDPSHTSAATATNYHYVLTPTATALQSSLNPSMAGQAVTFTATVTPIGVTGLVLFDADGTNIGSATLDANGVATLTTSALAQGTHTITATYNGTATHEASVSSPLTQDVTAGGTATTTTLASSMNPSNDGQPVTFTATVMPNSVTGNVTFFDGATTLGTGTIAGGVATFMTSALTPGPHAITATYNGDAIHSTSTSAELTQSVLTATSLTLASSGTPSVTGQSVTFTAGVIPSSATGTVTFKDGATTLGTSTLDLSGTATLATSALTQGTHTITATYNGNPSHATSMQTLTQDVLTATSTALFSSMNPSAVGQSVTFSATVTPAGVTGAVYFEDGSTAIGSAPVNGAGVATLTTSALAAGSHPIKATYGGDTTHATSFITLTQNVNTATTTAITSSLNPSATGQSVTFTATVTPSTATGTVTFKDGATPLGTGTLDASGVATFATSSLSSGAHTITATYGGNATHGSSVSSALAQDVINATSLALTSSGNPSAPGQPITFTATITPSTATGTIAFKDGATTLGTSPLNGSGIATLTTSSLPAGNHTITASYAGNASFASSTSSAVQQQIAILTTTSLTSAPNPGLTGDVVTFTATVMPNTATGTVTFKDGATTLGTGTLAGGVASLATTSITTPGPHTITATYEGDATHATSTSAPLTQEMHAQTSIVMTSSANPSAVGQSVTFTVTVTPNTATGTVTLNEGATTLATPTLINGQATYTTSSLTLGNHPITPVYSGDTSHDPSAGATLLQQVVATSTSASLTSSANPSTSGQSVTFTATITPNTATGNVGFYDGTTLLGTVALTSGSAAFSSSALGAGNHAVTATYVGDATHATSTSAPVSQHVMPLALTPTTTTLTSNNNPSVQGQFVTLTATVSPAATGSVTFLDGVFVLGTVNLNFSSQATIITASLSVGTHFITASYSGDATHDYSQSLPLAQVVTAPALPPTTTTLASDNNPSNVGQAVTFTATVMPAGATGIVTFFDGATTLGTGTLDASGVATLTTAALGAGTHTITASYGGDATHATSTSAPLAQMVNSSALSPTATSLSASSNPATTGQNVVLTATVSPAGANATGTVDFYQDSNLVGSGTVDPVTGVAQFTLVDVMTGSHDLVAIYNGDATHSGSQSNVVTLVVVPLAATVTDVPALDPRALVILAIALAAASIFVLKR